LDNIRRDGHIVIPDACISTVALPWPDRFADQPISLFAATMASKSEQFNLPVWTFDHHCDLMGIAVWRER